MKWSWLFDSCPFHTMWYEILACFFLMDGQRCSELEGTLAEQLPTVVNFLQEINTHTQKWRSDDFRGAKWDVGTWRQCHIGRYTQCQRAVEKCEECISPIKSTANPGHVDEGHFAAMSNGKKKKCVETIRSVKPIGCKLRGERARRPETKHKRRQNSCPRRIAEIPSTNSGLAIGGSEEEKSTTATAKRHWSTIVGANSRNRRFPHPEGTLPQETPKQGELEGWWYPVWSVILCRECWRCDVRKESTGFPPKEWKKKQPATCVQCVLGQHAGQASASASRRANKGK